MKSKIHTISSKNFESHIKSLDLPEGTMIHFSYEDRHFKDIEPQEDTIYVFDSTDTEELLRFAEKIPSGMIVDIKIQSV